MKNFTQRQWIGVVLLVIAFATPFALVYVALGLTPIGFGVAAVEQILMLIGVSLVGKD